MIPWYSTSGGSPTVYQVNGKEQYCDIDWKNANSSFGRPSPRRRVIRDFTNQNATQFENTETEKGPGRDDRDSTAVQIL